MTTGQIVNTCFGPFRIERHDGETVAISTGDNDFQYTIPGDLEAVADIKAYFLELAEFER